MSEMTLQDLTCAGAKGVVGAPSLFVPVEGRAEPNHDPAQFAAHWTKHPDHWSENGVDTPGPTMIRVRGPR